MPGDDVAEAPLECNDQSLDCGENATTATITALLPRGAKGNAFTVELSNGERLSLRSETVATHRLSVGDTVDSAAITAWQRDNSARLAVEAGLNFISFRPRSTKEVADHLRKKSLDTAARDHAIGRLQELGYLDDAAFARFWVESRDTHRPRGKRALAGNCGKRALPTPSSKTRWRGSPVTRPRWHTRPPVNARRRSRPPIPPNSASSLAHSSPAGASATRSPGRWWTISGRNCAETEQFAKTARCAETARFAATARCAETTLVSRNRLIDGCAAAYDVNNWGCKRGEQSWLALRPHSNSRTRTTETHRMTSATNCWTET